MIVEINKERIQDAEEAVRLSESPADKTTLLKVWSRGGTRFVVVDETGNSIGMVPKMRSRLRVIRRAKLPRPRSQVR